MKRKNITVKQDIHQRFKNYADEKGMKYEPFLIMLMENSRKFEAIKGI